MKKLFVVLMLILIPCLVLAQYPYKTVHRSITITLDSTEVGYIYLGFPGAGGGVYLLSESSIDPKDVIWTTFDCLVYFSIDSVAAVSESDSLYVWALKLAHDGKTWGDTMHLDIGTDHAVETSLTWLDWTPQSARSNTNHYYYWADLTAEYEPGTFGFEFGFDQRSSGGSPQTSIEFHSAETE